jgi:hypothetical protein
MTTFAVAGNVSINERAVARLRPATTIELLEAMFSMQFVTRQLSCGHEKLRGSRQPARTRIWKLRNLNGRATTGEDIEYFMCAAVQ